MLSAPCDWRQRLQSLQTLLQAHADYWRPSPFREPRPAWCLQNPALAAAVLALDETAVEALAADPQAAQAWMLPLLPELADLAAQLALPPLAARTLPPLPRGGDVGIPGRKLAQIEAFVAATPPSPAPILDWCAGKGHLGRRAALADDVALSALEIDPLLSAEAARLAARVGLPARLLTADARSPAALAQITGQTVLALHACGELHRGLVRSAAETGARAYRIAPCCYHRDAAAGYRGLSRVATLDLDANALKLAVTETVTAPAHDRRKLARDQAFKLGFLALQSTLTGAPAAAFRPVPPGWLAGDFEPFGRALAAREGLRLPAAVDWARWQAEGERRRGELRRLELVRHAFRRALETWLVLDLAVALEDAGYHVQLGPFCDRALTPRNLLLLADRD